MQLVLLGISSILVSLCLILGISKLYYRFGLLDNPQKYGYKRDPVPYSMGVIFFLNFVIVSSFFIEPNLKYYFLLLFGTIITLLSFFDDFFDISPKVRLLCQILIGAVIGLAFVKTGYIATIFGGINLNQISLYFFEYQFFLVPVIFAVVWYVMIFNALNWSDGIPGLTSGLSFVSFLVIFLLGVKLYFTDTYVGGIENAIFIMQMSLIVLTSVGVFWFFDFKPRMLMGDSGTMFLGFMLASLAIISGGKIATVVVVFGVYLIDAFYVIFRRILSGKSPMKKDFTHLHHRLLDAGLEKSQVLIFIYSLSFFFGIASLFLHTFGKVLMFILLTFIVVFVNFFIDILRKIRKKARIKHL